MRIILSLSVMVLFAISVFLSNYSDKPLFAFQEEGNVLSASAEKPELTETALVVPSDPESFPDNADKPIVLPPKRTGGVLSFPGVSGAVLDAKTGEALFDSGKESPVPIASITKLATAVIFLRHNPGWDTIHEVLPEDLVPGGKDYLRVGDKLTAREFFELSLIASENNAARVMARISGLEDKDFIEEMNSMATEIGLKKTSFKDPVGINKSNVSTPLEVARLARFAFGDKDIAETVSRDAVVFRPNRKTERRAPTTNTLLNSDETKSNIRVSGGKTGFTVLAGYCFVGSFVDRDGHEIISVVLGDDSKSGRFTNAKKLSESIFKNYTWQ